MAQMLVIYKTPKDPAAFDKHYFEVHVPFAKNAPVRRSRSLTPGRLDRRWDGCEINARTSRLRASAAA
jgi:uncharacterized protein (TIGR02118 family)